MLDLGSQGSRVWGCEEMRDEEERSREGGKQRGSGTGVWKPRKKPPLCVILFFSFFLYFTISIILTQNKLQYLVIKV